MLFVTNLAPPIGLFSDAMSWETMYGFVSNWLVKLVLLGIIGFGLWHAAHRLRVCAHDFGIRADTVVAYIVYGLAGIGYAGHNLGAADDLIRSAHVRRIQRRRGFPPRRLFSLSPSRQDNVASKRDQWVVHPPGTTNR